MPIIFVVLLGVVGTIGWYLGWYLVGLLGVHILFSEPEGLFDWGTKSDKRLGLFMALLGPFILLNAGFRRFVFWLAGD